jgi:peptidoglycan-N-acetylglucosamine deacetylase
MGSPSALRVALTFDAEHPDRPDSSPGAVERILDALGLAGARATFFVQGRWAESHPAVSGRIAAEGHLVGSHSHYHAPMPLLSDRGIRHDARAAAAAIRRATGTDPRPWFRCPFTAGEDDPRVTSVLASMGYRIVSEDVVPRDWEPGSPEALADAIVEGVAARGDGAIVLLHTWPARSAEALPLALARLREDGVAFAGVDEIR